MKTLPLLLGAALFILPGCTAVETGQAKAELAELKATTAQAKATATDDLGKAVAAGNRPEVERLAKTLEALDEAEKRLKQLEGIVNASTNPDGSTDVGGAIGAAGALLPPPWNVVALLGGPLIGLGIGEIRRRRAQADAVSIIDGLSAAQMHNPGLKTALKASETVLKKEYTPGAVALVQKHKLASE